MGTELWVSDIPQLDQSQHQEQALTPHGKDSQAKRSALEVPCHVCGCLRNKPGNNGNAVSAATGQPSPHHLCTGPRGMGAFSKRWEIRPLEAEVSLSSPPSP
ncbi:hypothetical protein GW7_14792 [Heterocephalus glaber]|uniref:Uncharacterized protein n=1 Tax=Heterocephalus glaber TaxID=10181 RepID=G5B479_HETGA|nr:hypothetical protein GW7_14792 [Heterocephalus glaber]